MHTGAILGLFAANQTQTADTDKENSTRASGGVPRRRIGAEREIRLDWTMASQGGRNESSGSLPRFPHQAGGTTAMSSPSFSSSSSSSSSSSDDEDDDKLGCSSRLERRVDGNRSGTDRPTARNLPRREDNPFSFKHFLSNDSQTNYQLAGARPKVYSPPATSPEPSCLESEALGVYPRNPTELPDFVQDHLIVEQCYLTYETSAQPIAADVENLPDFALNSIEQRQSRRWNEPKKCQSETPRDLQFDLTDSIDRGRGQLPVPSTLPSSAPLDLPTFDGPNQESGQRSRFMRFPFDLQPSSCESASVSARSCPAVGEANVIKSLPDFLSDGPIRNRAEPPSADVGPGSSAPDTTDRPVHVSSLLSENERLRHELEIARRQAEDKSRRIQSLESELASRRVVDHEETAHLEKAMEQVEDNLKRSTRRAVNAESTVTVLKEQVKLLTTEISALRTENRRLGAGTTAGCNGNNGNNGNNGSTRHHDVRIKRLASDLRTAASTAEISLGQLMSGVDNLKMLASALENVDRIEDRTKDFLADFDEDSATGPAL